MSGPPGSDPTSTPACAICERIRSVDASYPVRPAAHDLGSAAPRCARHWRYVCAACGTPAHFAASAFCIERRRFFCARCAEGREEVAEPVWVWPYALRYRSPWTGAWCWALDRAEAEGMHPLDDPDLAESAREAISTETHLVRYPETPVQWWSPGTYTDERVRDEWNANAERWSARYDDDGDFNRRYLSDPVLLDVLGDVHDLDVVDAGSGNGYLCRKLARAGASTVGVELSDGFVEIAREAEQREPLGVVYHRGSVSSMAFLPDACADRVVSNYVLQDVLDLEETLAEIRRLLRPCGRFVCVVFHPCFGAGPAGWEMPAPDSPRPEDRTAFRVDDYFRRSPSYAQWGNLDPVLSFHRTLTDYWRAFEAAGFTIARIEEPSVSPRGERELPISQRLQSGRIPYSLVLDLRLAALRTLGKAVAFVVREGARGRELLVFRHPLSGDQVPKGTLEPWEVPATTVLRELAEESGVRDAVITHRLGTVSLDGTTPPGEPADGLSGIPHGTRHVWHLFALRPGVPLPDRWEHEAIGSEEEEGLVFAYRWISLTDAEAVLHPAFAPAVRRLVRAFG